MSAENKKVLDLMLPWQLEAKMFSDSSSVIELLLTQKLGESFGGQREQGVLGCVSQKHFNGSFQFDFNGSTMYLTLRCFWEMQP